MMEMKRIVYSSDIGMKYIQSNFIYLQFYDDDDSTVFGDQDVDLSNEMIEIEVK
jgi:hypothetical protein